MYDTCIVGGGLAGLSCAYELTRSGKKVVVIEKSDVLGGRIRTLRTGGSVIEMGASFFAGFYKEVNRLVTEAGVDVDRRSDSQETWLCKADGSMATIWPASSLASSDAISLIGKIRATSGVLTLICEAMRLRSLDAGAALNLDDATIENWCRAKFGREFYSGVIEPLLRSLFFWDPRHTSRALLPLVVKGVTTDRNFYRVAEGMDTIPQVLGRHFEHKLGTPVRAVTRSGNAFEIEAGEEVIHAKSLVLACPGSIAESILVASGIDVPEALAAVKYTTVSVGVLRLPTEVELDGLASRTTVFSTDRKTPLIALKPVEGKGGKQDKYLRFYWDSTSDAIQDLMAGIPDVLRGRGLVNVADAASNGDLVDLVRWEQAIPVFDVGSLAALDTKAAAHGLPPGIFLAGDYMVAPHLEGAVTSGRTAAEDVRAFLGPAQ